MAIPGKPGGRIEAAQGTRLYLPILLTTCTGIRRGEILAAVWSNIEEHGGTLRVDRALSETKQAGVILKKTKSKRARTVALPQLLIEALDSHRNEQDKNREMLGATYCDGDLICCQPDGAVWKPSAFTSAYRALLSRRGLDGPNFHALRHSHASHMLRNGVDYKEVSNEAGPQQGVFHHHTVRPRPPRPGRGSRASYRCRHAESHRASTPTEGHLIRWRVSRLFSVGWQFGGNLPGLATGEAFGV